jgi:hypothetical protein
MPTGPREKSDLPCFPPDLLIRRAGQDDLETLWEFLAIAAPHPTEIAAAAPGRSMC